MEYPGANSTMTAPSIYGDAKSVSDVPRVSRETGMIQKLLAEHGEMATNLGQRLHAVLRPTEPVAGLADAKDQRDVSSPLTSDLEAFRLQLGQLLARYRDIADRLEV